MTDLSFDFDLIVIGAGYGGFDAAKHAAAKGLKVAIIESSDMGGTCVNKGCVPSKALLAASGKVREIANYEHLAKFGIHTSPVRFERSKIADHANNLVLNVRENLTKTLKRSGVEIILGIGRLEGNQKVGVRDSNGVDRILTCKNVIIATGSSPFVPRGITLDNRTVFTSNDAVKLEWLPRWVAIIGSGYIGLEFADVYTALGCEVTMIEALENIMPTFDPDITKIAKKSLIEIGGKAVGNLQMSASQTIANYWLPPVLAKFQTINPDAKLNITMSNTAGVENSILNGSAEIGFVEGEITSEQLLVTDVDDDQPVLVAAEKLFTALNQNYNDTDIKNLPWVVREVGSGTRRLLEYFMNSRQIEWDEVNIALELPSNEAVRQAVESGAGITLLSEYVVSSSVKSGLLKLIPVELPVRKFRLITHRNRKFSNVSQAFIEMLTSKNLEMT